MGRWEEGRGVGFSNAGRGSRGCVGGVPTSKKMEAFLERGVPMWLGGFQWGRRGLAGERRWHWKIKNKKLNRAIGRKPIWFTDQTIGLTVEFRFNHFPIQLTRSDQAIKLVGLTDSVQFLKSCFLYNFQYKSHQFPKIIVLYNS